MVSASAAAVMVRLSFAILVLTLVMAPWSYLLAAVVDGGKAASTPCDGTASIERGRKLFESAVCGSCHALADAGATGQVGPSLDGNPNLTDAFVVNRIMNGQGAMPAFGDQLSEEEIADLAAYVMYGAAK